MSRSVLVIDDDDDIREVARLSLERVGGYVVHTASDGRSGVATAAAERPDAILLDVMMPDTDGPATLELLRGDEATREIPVIFLTAKVRSSDRRRLLDTGVDGVLAKPFDPMTLHREVAAALGWDT